MVSHAFPSTACHHRSKTYQSTQAASIKKLSVSCEDLRERFHVVCPLSLKMAEAHQNGWPAKDPPERQDEIVQ